MLNKYFTENNLNSINYQLCVGAMFTLTAATVGVTDIDSDPVHPVTSSVYIIPDYQVAPKVDPADMVGWSQIASHSQSVTERLKADLEIFWEEIESGSFDITPEELELANRVLEKYPDAFS